MKIMFWNVHRNEKINNIISELVIENGISMVVLAEYTADACDLINILKSNDIMFESYPCFCDRISIIGKKVNISPIKDTSYYTIQVINNKDILCCVHLISQMYAGASEDREIIIEQIVKDIEDAENEFNTNETIIVGDFNINPYDQSCIDARYFHGIPVYEEAKRKTRIVKGKEFSVFYNPMWSFLGDKEKPYGTYYYNNSTAVNTYWNVFDQVIMRPSVKRRFVSDSLQILTETQTRYLLDNNDHPDKNISDHLPIVFEIMEDDYGEET